MNSTENISCRFPWTWLNINLDDDSWRFCCKTNWYSNFTDTYYPDNEILSDVQSSFTNSIKHKDCSICWNDEELGGNSFRIQKGGIIPKPQLEDLNGLELIDVVYGSLCNLKCGTCGPVHSTQWQNLLEKYQLPVIKTHSHSDDHISRSWNKLKHIIYNNLQTLKKISLYGGEPSIDPRFLNLLDYLYELDIDHNKIELHVYTNGMWPNESSEIRFISGLNKIKNKGWNVKLRFSIDAVYENAEFIRIGTKWNIYEKNLDLIVSEGLCTELSITTSLFNISSQGEIMDFILSKPYADKIYPIFNLANKPSKVSISNLGYHIVDYAPVWNFNHPNWADYKNSIASLIIQQKNGIPNSSVLKSFVQYTEWLSFVNNISIPKELDEIYKTYLQLR